MRIIHSADWHLGRLFHGASLIEDQAYILEDLCRLVRDEKADVLIIAGDVYDRRQPPESAIRLLDAVLSEVINDIGVTVFMIAGNHDSSTLINFGSNLYSQRGLHVRGPCSTLLEPVTLTDADGPIDFCLIPYQQAEPLSLRTTSNDNSIRSFDQAMAHATTASLAACTASRRVAIAHCFTSGGDVSDSERPLSVGGSDQVSPAHFRDFNYAALGHLHRPQRVSDTTEYSGSLLKYSFSEAEHKKSVNMIDIDASGNTTLQRIALRRRRDLRVIEGELKFLLEATDDLGKNDYILARLLDTGALHDPLAQLRKRYPNIAYIERPKLFQSIEDSERASTETLRRTDSDLFADFYQQVTGNTLSQDEVRQFEHSVEAFDREHGK